jgi:hypothetical protein
VEEDSIRGGRIREVTQTKTAPRPEPKTRPRQEHEPVPTWKNTRPRGNPEPDERDLARSRERWEALLGR